MYVRIFGRVVQKQRIAAKESVDVQELARRRLN